MEQWQTTIQRASQENMVVVFANISEERPEITQDYAHHRATS